MKIIADLHLHSKYSRAVSPQMELKTMAWWAEKKGIDLLATGDWTHPMWFKEIESNLEEDGEGIFKVRGLKSKMHYVLSCEISNIYTKGGKGRRIHTVFLAPSFKTVRKINAELTKRGGNLLSDGRPILGFSMEDMCEIVWGIDEKVIIMPAHCLLPNEMITTNEGIRTIEMIKNKDKVLTHRGRFKKVDKVMSRKYKGKLYHIIPWHFSLGLKTTSEHPFYAIKTEKQCKWKGGICRPFGKHLEKCTAKHYIDYKPEWIEANKLEKGDLILYPRIKKNLKIKKIRLTDVIEGLVKKNGKVKILGKKSVEINNEIKVDENLGRLIGYYLAEGYIYGNNGISFCFNKKEINYVKDVKELMLKVFGVKKSREYYRKGSGGVELSFSSMILTKLFKEWFYTEDKSKKAHRKQIPSWMLWLDLLVQKEILVGWWAGDKGYTTSRELMNQMKVICIRLGILPGIGVDTATNHKKRGHHNRFENREIKANHDLYYFNHLCFFKDKYKLLSRLEKGRFKSKLKRRHGWMDNDYVYLPIRKIVKKQYKGKVYNLEISEDNSYVTEFATVHNCWTPWFSMFGSKSGFDSVEECFGKYADRIYAIETGLSSDPLMNWKIKDLETRAIVSSSDAHSLRKMGREATVFDFKKDKYGFSDLAEGLRRGGKENKIVYTIEFHPEEGKYHYTGHRKCGVIQSPEETRKNGTVCHVCGKGLTVGVMHRVEELAQGGISVCASKVRNFKWYYHPDDKGRPPYIMLVPLQEIISEAVGVGVASKKVQGIYEEMIAKLGNEFNILMKVKISEVKKIAGERVAEALKKVRIGDMVVEPGYDGEFGVVKIWGEKGNN